jgi:hypothetical protein
MRTPPIPGRRKTIQRRINSSDAHTGCPGAAAYIGIDYAGEKVNCPHCHEPYTVRGDGHLRAHRILG